MGLAINVGVLADLLKNDPEGAEWLEGCLASANRLLHESRLPCHDEPRDLMLSMSRASLKGFPYSFLHYLRYAYAHRAAAPDWIAQPLSDSIDPAMDMVVEAELEQFSSHLLCHSDCEGYYLPIDFETVLFDTSSDRTLPGGMLCSSFRLLEELIFVSPALGIQLIDGVLTDEEANRINERSRTGDGLYRELYSWLVLYEAARLSIAHKTAIVFC